MPDAHATTGWLILLERARLIGDPELERRAREELARLGVYVTYRRPRRQKRAKQEAVP